MVAGERLETPARTFRCGSGASYARRTVLSARLSIPIYDELAIDLYQLT